MNMKCNYTNLHSAAITLYSIFLELFLYIAYCKYSVCTVLNFFVLYFSGITQLTNTTYKSDLIVVTWEPASSPYCGEVLYYQVVISSDEHVNIANNIVSTIGLTATFLNLRNNTFYTITVTAVNKAGSGRTFSVSVNTATRSQS